MNKQLVIKKKVGCNSEYHLISDEGIHNIFINKLKVGDYRYATLGVYECLVVPVTIIVEGVHNGFFYPAEELKKSVSEWENVLLPIYHPQDENGQFLSAKEVEAECVGRFLNSTWDDNKKGIVGEFWLIKEKLTDSIINELINGNMEVSTGLFAVQEDGTSGEWNTEKYEAVLKDYTPDHVALLPGSLGACSWLDGCGVRANIKINKKEERKEVKEIAMFKNLIGLTRKIVPFKLISNEEEKVYFEKYKSLLGGMLTNELSYEDIRYNISQMLRDSFKTPTEQYPDVYVRDTFENYFIFERVGKLYKQEYSIDDKENILLGKGITEMKQKSEYVPLTNMKEDLKETQKEKQKQIKEEIINKEEVSMDKKALIDNLIANEKAPFKEEHRVTLEGMEEAILQSLVDQYTVKEVKEVKTEKIDNEKKDEKEDKTVKVNTVEEYLAKETIPDEMRSILNASVNLYRTNKANLIKVILECKTNKFTKEMLEKKDMDELSAIASLIEVKVNKEDIVPDFSGNLEGYVKKMSEISNERQSDGSGVPIAAIPKWNKDGTPDYSEVIK